MATRSSRSTKLLCFGPAGSVLGWLTVVAGKPHHYVTSHQLSLAISPWYRRNEFASYVVKTSANLSGVVSACCTAAGPIVRSREQWIAA